MRSPSKESRVEPIPFVRAPPRPATPRGFSRLTASMALVAAVICIGLTQVAPEAAGQVQARPSKLDRHLQDVKRDPGGRERVIVQTAHGKKGDVEERLKKRGKSRKADLRSVNGFVADVEGADLAALEADPDVLHVSTDAVVQSTGLSIDTENGLDTLEEVLGIGTTELTGDKVGIAIIDSGLDRGDDLDGGRTDKFFNFTDAPGDKPFDDYGHGTHVAGLVGGTGKLSKIKIHVRDGKGNLKKKDLPYYRGIAPKARLFSFKVLNEHGAGYTSQVIQALDYIVEHKDNLKIDIVNLSLGHPVLEPAATDPLVSRWSAPHAPG